MNAATATLPLLTESQRVMDYPSARVTVETERLQEDQRASQPEGDVPPKRQRAIFKPLLLASLALLVVAGGSRMARHWWTVGRFMEKTDDAYIGGDVTVLATKVPGFIAEVAVQDNQQVHAGELLIRLDDRDYRAAQAQATATVAAREAALGNLDATRSLQHAVVNQTQAEVNSADAEISRAHDDQVRYQRLVEDRAVSVQSSQKADTDYRQALAAGDRARANQVAAERKLEVIASQKLEASAALQQARAELEIARLNLSYTEVRAPIDGTIGNRSARLGAFATAGAQLVTVVPARGLWIDANFKESQLVQVRPNSPAAIKVDSLPGQVFRGHVVSVAPATGAQFSVLPAENATGNFTKIVQRVTVRIALDNESETQGQLRPGLSVTAEVNGRSTLKASR